MVNENSEGEMPRAEMRNNSKLEFENRNAEIGNNDK